MRDFDFEPTPLRKGRHTVWRRDGFRHLTINYRGKHLDDRSFRSSLRTLGIRNEDFWAFLKVIHSTSGRPRVLNVDFTSFAEGDVLQTTEEPSRASTS